MKHSNRPLGVDYWVVQIIARLAAPEQKKGSGHSDQSSHFAPLSTAGRSQSYCTFSCAAYACALSITNSRYSFCTPSIFWCCLGSFHPVALVLLRASPSFRPLALFSIQTLLGVSSVGVSYHQTHTLDTFLLNLRSMMGTATRPLLNP